VASSPEVDASLLLRLEHAVDDLLARHREPERALHGILAELGTTLGWPLASVWMWRGTGLVQVAGWSAVLPGGSDRYARFLADSSTRTFAPGGGLPGRVWEAGHAMWFDELTDADRFPRSAVARRTGLTSALAFPFGHAPDGRPTGVIELFRDSPLHPDPTLLSTLASLGHRLGVHFARAREAAQARHGEALLRATVESALDAIVMADGDGLVVEFNPAASRVFGWTREQALGRDLADLIVPPRLRGEHRRAWAHHLESGERTILGSRIETVGQRRDGTEFPVELTITEAVVDGEFTFTGHLRDLTDRVATQRELLASRRRVVSAGDEARRRIERNLHDGAQQRMVSLSLLLGRARSALPADPGHAAELLDLAVAQISDAADELRTLARGIHPAGLTRYGLAAAVTDLARRTGAEVVGEPLPPERFDETVEVTAYYVVAEAVTNALRHAPGAHVEIGGALDGDHLVVRVADDGPGGATEGDDAPSSSGIAGLRDRVAAMGGTLHLTSVAGAGTQVVARLPVGPA
jgi:PAS domain S-box-containing protein